MQHVQHITSTSHHVNITSSHHIITSHHTTSHHIPGHDMTSHPIASYAYVYVHSKIPSTCIGLYCVAIRSDRLFATASDTHVINTCSMFSMLACIGTSCHVHPRTDVAHSGPTPPMHTRAASHPYMHVHVPLTYSQTDTHSIPQGTPSVRNSACSSRHGHIVLRPMQRGQSQLHRNHAWNRNGERQWGCY